MRDRTRFRAPTTSNEATTSLRREGAFFAAWDRGTGALLVKLAPTRVDELLAAGAAEPFAPAGRRFRQWVAVSAQRERIWPGLLHEALQFTGG